MKRKKEERRLCGATLKTAEVAQTYYIFLALQAGRGRDPLPRQDGIRHCVVCGVVVTNDSLGGHDGGPLSGKLWCWTARMVPLPCWLEWEAERR